MSPREREAILLSATGAAVDLAGGAVAVGKALRSRHRRTVHAEEPPPVQPLRPARPQESGA